MKNKNIFSIKYKAVKSNLIDKQSKGTKFLQITSNL